MEKTMENEMETGIIMGYIHRRLIDLRVGLDLPSLQLSNPALLLNSSICFFFCRLV